MIFLTVSKKSILFGIVWLLFLAIFLTLSVPEVNTLISSPQKIGFFNAWFLHIIRSNFKMNQLRVLISSIFFIWIDVCVFFVAITAELWLKTTNFLMWKLLKTSSTERAEWSQFIITYIIPLSIHVQPMWFYNLG